eukprot:210448-Ditylum_brightwellii.AAC.1
MTIYWHIDNLKILYADSREVTKILKVLESKYGNTKTIHGKVYNYLGMTFDYRKKGKVKVSMVKYTKKLVETFPEWIEGSVTTQAADHLFEVKENNVKLSEEKGRVYHTITAKLLFLCKRVRQDLQTAIAFLTTRVKEPNEINWKKLGQVILYLNGTINLDTTLSADMLNIAKWWVDGLYAAHPNMRGHKGSTVSMGK